jgi:hypothetical protein
MTQKSALAIVKCFFLPWMYDRKHPVPHKLLRRRHLCKYVFLLNNFVVVGRGGATGIS